MTIQSPCPPELLLRLRDALHSLQNYDELAAAICKATGVQRGKIEALSDGLNQLYLLFGTALVFVMHGGFAMLAAGAIRSKNAINILLQTLMDACASAIMWYLIGYGFAYGIGDHPNPFIGDAMFAFVRLKSHNTGSATGRWLDVVFNWAFCATAVTIPAGSVAERCNFNAYLCYSTFISAFLYPVVAHWVWCSRGWLGYGVLNPLLRSGMIDFAGSAVVHMLGGLSGLAGASLLGPRMGRFDIENQPVPLPGHSAVLVVLGTILLWFGWYGFNPVSTLFIDTAAAAEVASRSAVTTTLAGAAGGVGCLVWTLLRTRTFDLYALCNGVLCGFVAVTAGCHVYEPWAAIICGAGAGIIFDLANILLIKMKIDDPVGAAPMHGGCGAYGVMFVGLLAKKEYIMQSYSSHKSYAYGLFYGGGTRLLACQVIGVVTIAGWTLGMMFPFFWILKKLKLLRVPPEEELNGLDISRHYSRAYYIEDINNVSRTTFTTGTIGTITVVTQPGGGDGAIGDAIMRAELLGSTGSQQTMRGVTAWAMPVGGLAAGRSDSGNHTGKEKNGHFIGAKPIQEGMILSGNPSLIDSLSPQQSQLPESWDANKTSNRKTSPYQQQQVKFGDSAAASRVPLLLAQQSSKQQQQQGSVSAMASVLQQERPSGRVLEMQKGGSAARVIGGGDSLQQQQSVAAGAAGGRQSGGGSSSFFDSGSNDASAGAPAAPAVAAGGDRRPPSATGTTGVRSMTSVRSSKNAVAPLGGGGGWGGLGVSGAFEDGADISVHKLDA